MKRPTEWAQAELAIASSASRFGGLGGVVLGFSGHRLVFAPFDPSLERVVDPNGSGKCRNEWPLYPGHELFGLRLP